MKEFMGHKRRNYRRRICSESLGDDGEIERQDNDDNYNADGNGEGIQKLNRGEEEKRLIVAVNARVADFTESRGEVDGLLVVSEEGGASADDVIASSSTKNGDDVGGGQTGGRIACGIGFHMLRAMGWTEHTGLGQSGKGMVNPILPTAKAGNLGIGFNATSVFDTQQEAIRQVQKAKREERDRKQMLKLEKAQEAAEEDIFMRESFLAVSTTDEEPLESGIGIGDGATDSHIPKKKPGPRPPEIGLCPHCRQRFETKQGLKSHIQARHAKLLHATKKMFKKERRQNGSGKRADKGSTARALAPMKQDFSVYD